MGVLTTQPWYGRRPRPLKWTNPSPNPWSFPVPWSKAKSNWHFVESLNQYQLTVYGKLSVTQELLHKFALGDITHGTMVSKMWEEWLELRNDMDAVVAEQIVQLLHSKAITKLAL